MIALADLRNDELLALIGEHRHGHWYGRGDPRNFEHDPMLCLLLIGEAMRRKVYPARPQDQYPANPNSTVSMAMGWGADWITWREPLACPYCAADLRDRRVGPPFKREIGHSDRRKDMTTAYQCPDCKGMWPRVLKVEGGKIVEVP